MPLETQGPSPGQVETLLGTPQFRLIVELSAEAMSLTKRL